MKLLSILTLAGLAFSLAGTEQEFLENPPYAYNGIFVGRSAETERTPDGEAAFEVTARYGSADLAWPSQLRYNVSAEKLRGVERGVLEFWMKGPAGRSLRLALNSEDFAGDETIRYTKPGVFKMTGEWQKIVWPFEITCAVTGHYADMPRYALLNTIAGDKFLVGPVVLKVVSRKNFPGEPKAEVPAGWRALPESGLYIEPGSALDFRKFADRRPAGSLGRLIVNAQGKLAFERCVLCTAAAGEPRQALDLLLSYPPNSDSKDFAAYRLLNAYILLKAEGVDAASGAWQALLRDLKGEREPLTYLIASSYGDAFAVTKNYALALDSYRAAFNAAAGKQDAFDTLE
ncbi:MAG: hypothetical protein SPK75_09695, partial [Victivallales bacterium]|nr:hypothetical protein [Victivallales bacterium]